MQNTIAPITPTPPVESRPSPKSASPHAFATLLKQNQMKAPASAQAAPAPSPRKDGAADADATAATTRPAANATTAAADARRRDDAKSAADAGDAGRADAHANAADDASGHGDKDKADASATSGASGTGVPMTHGLIATHRPAVAMSDGASARAERGTTTNTGDAADAHGGAATSSTSASADALVARGPSDLARKDEPASFARAAAGPTDTNTNTTQGSASPLIELAKAASVAPGELRTESTSPTAIAPARDTAAANSAAPVDAAVATPLASPDFAQAFAVKVSVLVQDGVQRAELHLNPTEMGPVSVHIVVDGTQARIDFGADALATRQAIEAGLPELASALRDAGMTLQGGGVSQHARDPHEGAKPGDGSAASRGPWRDDDPRLAPVVRQRTVAAGGVDLYA